MVEYWSVGFDEDYRNLDSRSSSIQYAYFVLATPQTHMPVWKDLVKPQHHSSYRRGEQPTFVSPAVVHRRKGLSVSDSDRAGAEQLRYEELSSSFVTFNFAERL